MCRGSKLSARIKCDSLPILDSVAALARVPYRTGAATRNWGSYGEEVTLASGIADWQRDLLCDPQTSGGLLIAVAPQGATQVMAALHTAGFDHAAVIGEMKTAGRGESPTIEII
jgi:selenide,water dikinase